MGRGGGLGAGPPADDTPGLGPARCLGSASDAGPLAVQPGSLQLHGPGPHRPPRPQPVRGGPFGPGTGAHSSFGGQRLAPCPGALRAIVRDGDPVRRRRLRDLDHRRSPGPAGPRVGRRGADHGLSSPPGPESGRRPRHRIVAGCPQPAGSVQFHRLRSQRRSDARSSRRRIDVGQ